jgi:hypothetical protein
MSHHTYESNKESMKKSKKYVGNRSLAQRMQARLGEPASGGAAVLKALFPRRTAAS